MKRIYIIFCLTFLMFGQTVAQEKKSADKVALANQMYKQGQFTDAARIYEEELKKGVSAELYYNLANSYYKANEIGHAILNYERALRIDPGLDDASYNLQIAESKIVDNVNTSPTFFVRKWTNSLIKSYTTNQWAVISVVCFILMLALFFLFAFSRIRTRRKYSFFASVLFGILCVVALSFSGIRKDQIKNHHEAVIMMGAVAVKSSPDQSGTDLFQLHEGTLVKVKSVLGNWTEITLENGAVGWVEETAIERI